MSEIVYKIGSPKEFSESDITTLIGLLIKQGKVSKPTVNKVTRCYLLCLCKVDVEIASIGDGRNGTSFRQFNDKDFMR